MRLLLPLASCLLGGLSLQIEHLAVHGGIWKQRARRIDVEGELAFVVRPDTTGLQLEHRQAPVGPSAQAIDRTPDDDDASLRVHIIATHRKRQGEDPVFT